MKAIIPVAGYATRLMPLTENQPKALLKINNKAILGLFLSKLDTLGVIDEVVLVSNDKFFPHFQKWADIQTYSFPIRVVNDGTTDNQSRLGAVGDCVLGIETLNTDDHILIAAGDSLFEDTFIEMIRLFHDKDATVIATKELPLAQCSRFGVAEIDNKGQLISFVEKPESPKSPLVGIMNYIIHKRDVSLIAEGYTKWNQEKEMNAGEMINYMLSRGIDIFAYTIWGQWFDVGTKEQLVEAEAYFSNLKQ